MSKVKVEVNTEALIVEINLSKLVKNPYRDLNSFPIDEVVKVPSLIESYEKTGVWVGIQARPKDNMVDGNVVDVDQLKALIDADFDFSDVTWEIPFGHHRLFAAKQCGIGSLPVIVQPMSDEDMLMKMALENKEGYGSSVLAILETVRQVKANIADGLEAYETYDEYTADGGTFFESVAQFKNAKKNIGWRVIKRFLGKSWLDAQIRAPFNALSCIDKGYIDPDQFVNIKSLGHAEVMSGMISYIYEGGKDGDGKADAEVIAPDWPLICKSVIVERCIQLCSQGDKSKTVASLKRAYTMLRKNGTSPATALVSSKSKDAFNVYDFAKAQYLIPNPDAEKNEEGEELPIDYEGTLAKNLTIVEGLRIDPDWQDYAELSDLCDRLQKCAERRAQAGEGVKEEETPVGEGSADSLDGEVHGEGEAPAVEGAGSLESFEQVIDGFTTNIETTCANIDTLLAGANDIEMDEIMSGSLDMALAKIITLYITVKGSPAFKEEYVKIVADINDATDAPE